MQYSPGERVAAEIRTALALRRITQTQAAAALGVSQQALSRRLVGAVPLTVDELMALAKLLDVDPAWLLARSA